MQTVFGKKAVTEGKVRSKDLVKLGLVSPCLVYSASRALRGDLLSSYWSWCSLTRRTREPNWPEIS